MECDRCGRCCMDSPCLVACLRYGRNLFDRRGKYLGCPAFSMLIPSGAGNCGLKWARDFLRIFRLIRSENSCIMPEARAEETGANHGERSL